MLTLDRYSFNKISRVTVITSVYMSWVPLVELSRILERCPPNRQKCEEFFLTSIPVNISLNSCYSDVSCCLIVLLHLYPYIGNRKEFFGLIINMILVFITEEFYGKSSKGFWVSQNGDYIVYMITDTSNMSPISV